MAMTFKASSSSFSPSSHPRIIKASNIQSHQNLPFQVNHLLDDHCILTTKHKIITNNHKKPTINSNVVVKEMYAIVESVADRVEMHKNIGEQRNNWNHLLLTSVNGMITTAATMAGLGAINNGVGESLLALKLSSTLLYIASTGILTIMNKIQPSQLAEEQRNASRLFKMLHEELKTAISLQEITHHDVENAIEKVLALDKAYPLPLLGVMIDKFPKRVEPAVWWPKHEHSSRHTCRENGWNENLREEMKSVLRVLKKKDEDDYVKLAKLALNLNKFLAVSGPSLTGLAAIGSVFLGLPNFGTWPAFFAVVFGALALAVNTIEHGGQVGMVFEMYRSSAGYFKLMEENIESALDESENGEVFEAKVALELGRSLSELRDLANTASSSSRNPNSKEEFASKLF